MDLKQHKAKKGGIAIKSFFIFLAVNLIGLAVALILEEAVKNLVSMDFRLS